MEHRRIDRADGREVAQGWRDELHYHVERALQELHMAAQAGLHSVRVAHETMSEAHRALAGAAEAAAIMVDAHAPHVSDPRALATALRRAIAEPIDD